MIGISSFIGRIRLSKLGIWLGLILTLTGFWAYGQGNSTLNLAGFFYGLPLLLGGLALKSSELDPVPCTGGDTEDMKALRTAQATDTQAKLRSDVTRYRYGQDHHLEDTLKFLGLAPQEDEDLPELVGLREENRDGAYTLVLQFNTPAVPMATWQEKQDKMTRYFGPNVVVELTQPEAPQDKPQVEVAIVKTLATAVAA